MIDFIFAGSVGGLVAIAVYAVAQYLLQPKNVMPPEVKKAYDHGTVLLESGSPRSRRAMIMVLQASGFHRIYLDSLTDSELKHHFDLTCKPERNPHVSSHPKEE